MREKRGTYLFSEQYNAVRFLLLGRKEDLRKEYNTPLILSIIHTFYTPESRAKSNFDKLFENIARRNVWLPYGSASVGQRKLRFCQ